MTKPFLIITFSYLLIVCSVKAQSSSNLSSVESGRIDSIMNMLMKKYHTVGASIGIVDNKQMVFAKGYGFADRKNKIAANENTVYCIGSITKTFTAMAIMKLRDEGKIDLNKPAGFYLPELKIKSVAESGDVLKIKNLLTHTSGLTDGIMNNDMCSENKSVWTIIDDLNQQLLVQPADWKMNYSNLAFDLLGCIIERVSGMKYEEYIKQNILDKVQMPNSGFAHASAIANAAKGYLKDTIETPEPILRDMPAGRLMSNAVDMSKFMNMILANGEATGGQVISPSSIKDMESDHLGSTLLNCDSRFGYGMFIERMYNAEDTLTGAGVGHGGDTYVFHATMFVFPKIGLGFVVLTNSANGHNFCNSALIKLFNEYLQKVKGIKLHPDTTLKFTAKAMNNNITDLRELRGIYRTGSDDIIKVKTHGRHKVILKQKHGPTLLLTKGTDNIFTAKARIYGIVKIKIPSLNFAFEKLDGHIYIKDINTHLKRAEYMLVKDENPTQLSAEWKKAVGKYKVCNACQGNVQGIPNELQIKDGQLVLNILFPTGDKDTRAFSQVSSTIAAVNGIDRGSGMIIKILPNGHLYFSGYELVKE